MLFESSMYWSPFRFGQRGDVLDRVVGQVERLEVGQVLERLQVGDLVLGQLEQGQVLALLQAGQVLDVLPGASRM